MENPKTFIYSKYVYRQAEEFVREADVDGDGEIDYNEFVAMLTSGRKGTFVGRSTDRHSVRLHYGIAVIRLSASASLSSVVVVPRHQQRTFWRIFG